MGTGDQKYEKRSRAVNKRAGGASNGADGWHGWVNVTLTDDAKKQWFKWSQVPENFYGAFDALVRDGYKVTVKYEDDKDAFSAFVTPAARDHSNAGWGLSQRAGDPFTAVHRVVYVHAVVLAGDWDGYKTPVGWSDDWA